MELFRSLSELETTGGGYESLHVFHNRATKLRALVAIHNTRLGPALGGTRALTTYPDEDAAITDVLRLARGMTYKAALSGVPHGGGKAVILLPKDETYDRAALFARFGRFVDELGGHYITTEDSGTSPADMVHVRAQTRFVVGAPKSQGGSGDPSPMTALGVLRGIEAVAKAALDRSDIEGVKVALLGVGHVGHSLATQLHEAGADLVVADVDPAKVERVRDELGCRVTTEEAIFSEPCDIFSPNALGACLNDHTLPQLKCRAVAGAANNQLAEDRHGRLLFDRGILYAPDYAINAGGLINVASEWSGYDEASVRERVGAIHDTLLEIFARSKTQRKPTSVVADQLAEERFKKG
jgi:leucine dehydrogenase